MKRFLANLVCCFLIIPCLPGQKVFKHGISFLVENEIVTDQYYSSGQELSWRTCLKETHVISRLLSGKKDSLKRVNAGLHYGNKIYTPSDLTEEAFLAGTQDRPYAGWQYIRLDFMHSPKAQRLNYYNIDIGWVGPKTGLQDLQTTWHAWWDIWEPFGWEDQIVDELTINVNYGRIQEWKLGPYFGLISNSQLFMGNRLNQVTQEIAVRLGDFFAPAYSSLFYNRIAREYNPFNKKESFFMIGSKLNGVLSNIFIEGSLFNNPSPFTKDIQSFYWNHFAGFQISELRYTIYLAGHYLSAEVVEGNSHFYLSFNLGFRI